MAAEHSSDTAEFRLEKRKNQTAFQRDESVSDFLNKEERYLSNIFEVERICELFTLNHGAVQEVKGLYFRALRKNITQGRAIERTVGSLIFHVVRARGIPITMRDIAGKIGVGTHSLFKSYRKVKRGLGLRSIVGDYSNLVARYHGMLKLEPILLRRALGRYELLQKMNLTNDPRVISAFCIYAAAGIEMSEVCEVSGVSESAIRELERKVSTCSS